MPHDPSGAIFDMIQAVERAQRLSSKFSEAQFMSNETVQWAIFSQIVILGEAAGRLDRVFHDSHPHIPWVSIIGMRHRLVHGYDSVDWGRVWKTLQNDLPPLLQQLKALMPEQGGKMK